MTEWLQDSCKRAQKPQESARGSGARLVGAVVHSAEQGVLERDASGGRTEVRPAVLQQLFDGVRSRRRHQPLPAATQAERSRNPQAALAIHSPHWSGRHQ